MQTQHPSERASAKAEDLTPTPTQAELDAAMIAATGGDAAAGPPEDAARKPAAPAASPAPAHEPERRTPSR